jgi:hypothetical protein
VFERQRLGDELSLGVFDAGAKRELKVTYSTDKDPRRVRRVNEPYDHIEYEAFGGLVVAQLAVNHLPMLMQKNPMLAAYLVDPAKQLEPELVITNVFAQSLFDQANDGVGVRPGSLLRALSGTPVRTIADYRRWWTEHRDTEFVEFTTATNRDVCLRVADLVAADPASQAMFHHPASRTYLALSAAAPSVTQQSVSSLPVPDPAVVAVASGDAALLHAVVANVDEHACGIDTAVAYPESCMCALVGKRLVYTAADAAEAPWTGTVHRFSADGNEVFLRPNGADAGLVSVDTMNTVLCGCKLECTCCGSDRTKKKKKKKKRGSRKKSGDLHRVADIDVVVEEEQEEQEEQEGFIVDDMEGLSYADIDEELSMVREDAEEEEELSMVREDAEEEEEEVEEDLQEAIAQLGLEHLTIEEAKAEIATNEEM